MAKLPYLHGDLKALGSPMLAALRGRSAEGGATLAMEERHYRQMAFRFIEAAFALHFRTPGAAADQMTTAIRGLDEAGGSKAGDDGPDAAQLLAQADGIDAKITLRESLRTLGVLAQLAAGRRDEALAGVLRLLIPDTLAEVPAADLHAPWTARLRRQRLLTCSRPLSVTRWPPRWRSIPQRSGRTHNRGATRCSHRPAQQARTAELFASRPLASRYPHIAALNEQIGQRLTSPQYYLEQAVAMRRRGELDRAADLLTAGVVRHPSSQELWIALLDAQMEQVRRGSGNAAMYAAFLDRVNIAEKGSRISAFSANYYRGLVHESLGRKNDVLADYERAAGLATASDERVRAHSKAASLRVRLVAGQG